MLESQPLAIFDFWIFSDVNAFLATFILFAALIGLFSRAASPAALAAFIVFAHIGHNVDLFIFTAFLYLSYSLMGLIMAYRITNYLWPGGIRGSEAHG